MNNQTLTVLMAVYNGEKYIRASVESILQQSFADFEFLIINDKSADHTLKILEEYQKKDSRIIIHTNESNLGQTKSLNVGLKLATGGYIARIDADDIALPLWLERQMIAIQKKPKDAVISVQALVIDESNRIKRIARSPGALGEIILRSFTFSPVNHVGSLLKKEAILKNGGYNENYKTAADYDLWGKLVRNNERMSSSSGILMAIRMHANSYSMTEIDKGGLAEISSIMKKNIDYFTHLGIKEDEAVLVCHAFYQEGILPDDEFDRAMEILKRMYGDISIPEIAPQKIVNKWLKARCTTAYLKRVYFFITQKNYAASRKLSWKGVMEFGPISVFMALWGASLLGRVVLSFIPEFYNLLLRQKTRLYFGIQLPMGMFN